MKSLRAKAIPGDYIAFLIAIDAIKVTQYIQVNHKFKIIVGGLFLNYAIDIVKLIKQDIVDILEQMDQVKYIMHKASEVKVAIIVLQVTKDNTLPFLCVGTRP